MSSIQILQLCAIVINITLILRSALFYVHIQTSRAWVYSYVLITLWAFCDLMQNIVPNPSYSVLWSRGTDVTATLASAFLLRFMLMSIYPDILRYRKVLSIHMSVAMVLSLFGLFTPMFTYETVPTWWGNYPHHTIWFYVLNLYTVGNGLITLLLPMIRFRILNDMQQKQMRLFLIGYSIPIVGGIASEILAPAVSLQVPPVTSILFSVTGICMAYAIERYNFFSFTPQLILNEIFNSIKDILIVLDKNGHIVLANKSVNDITGLQKKELMEHSISTLLYRSVRSDTPSDYFFQTSHQNERMYIHSTAEQKDIPLLVDNTIIRDTTQIQGIILYGRDMTQMDILVDELRLKTADLQSSKESLEQKIQEIQRVNQAMIGRELKMIEMKHEMQKLQDQITSSSKHTAT